MGAFSGLSVSGDLIADYFSMETEVEQSFGVLPNDEDRARASAESLLQVSHRLRSPLNAVNGFATMLRDANEHGLTEEIRQEYASYILKSGEKLLGDINLLMSAANIDVTSEEISQTADAIIHLDHALKAFEPFVQAKGIAVENKTIEKTIPIAVRPSLFDYALSFCLEAAVERSKDAQSIYIRAENKIREADKAVCTISIRDFGPSIDRERFKQGIDILRQTNLGPTRIFSLDSQDAQLTDETPNTWFIKLLLADRALHLANGNFSFKSSDGQGAILTMAIPIRINARSTSSKRS
ncbi:MAG: histidine kinase dimerization/phospho-acceptor domain-containing protein [Pseudomonadota bacterium]